MAAQRQLARYIQLIKEKKELECKLKKIKTAIEENEPEVLEHFQKYGLKNMSQDGLTLYLKRELWAGRAEGVEAEEAIKALQHAGLSEYAAPRVNTVSLSGYLRELDRDGEPFPKELEGIINLNEVFKIGSRNGSN